MNAKDLIDKDDLFLLERMNISDTGSSKTEQAKTILEINMMRRLIESLNKNSKSADDLSTRLNWLTFAIAFGTFALAATAIIQTVVLLFK